MAALSVKRITLWRREVENQPGVLATTLEPLAQAGADLRLVMGYRFPETTTRAAIELYPITGKRAVAAAEAAGLRAFELPCLLVEGDNRAGLRPGARRRRPERRLRRRAGARPPLHRRHGLRRRRRRRDGDEDDQVGGATGEGTSSVARARKPRRATRLAARARQGEHDHLRRPALDLPHDRRVHARRDASMRSTRGRARRRAIVGSRVPDACHASSPRATDGARKRRNAARSADYIRSTVSIPSNRSPVASVRAVKSHSTSRLSRTGPSAWSTGHAS